MDLMLNPTILICDDEPLVVSSLARAFRKAGVDSVPVTQADDCLGAAVRCKPNLILLDLKQRETSGTKLLEDLKQDPRTRGIKVVIITGVIDPFVRISCMDLGATGYATKPFNEDFIAQAIRMAREDQERSIH